MSERKSRPIPLHPRAGEAWFEALPDERRVEFVGEWQALLARREELVRAERARAVRETILTAALFGVSDPICPGRTLATCLLAVVLGAAVGWIGNRFDWHRFAATAVGFTVFFLFQWWSRGGLSALHLLVLFPFTSACAYTGYVREDRGSL